MVGIVIRLRPVEASAGTPLGATELSVLQNVRTDSGAHLSSCSGVLYQGLRRSGNEADHSLSFDIEDKY